MNLSSKDIGVVFYLYLYDFGKLDIILILMFFKNNEKSSIIKIDI
tara:strand:+ start:3410 stop:3544 length:135 start_codon:yes stop_codon:yes gene_type:complete